MSEEVKQETKKEESHALPQGDRGQVGEASSAQKVKQMYHEAHFKRVDANDKHNPRKRLLVKHHGAPSLKKFARELAKSGNQDAKDWFSCKKGALNSTRSAAALKRIDEEKRASKAARRKSKAGKPAEVK